MNAWPCPAELIILKSTIWGQLKIALLTGVEGRFIPVIAASQKVESPLPNISSQLTLQSTENSKEKGETTREWGISHAPSREKAPLTSSSSK